MNDASKNLSKEVPTNIVKGASLEKTVNDLFDTFEAGEQRNAELINRFFDQTYFRGGESLINKLAEVKSDIKFEDIKDEGINLATLLYDNWMWDFNVCINKIGNIEIKRAIVNEIYNKVRAKIGVAAPYNDFDTKCAIPLNANVVEYFQKIVNYLESKEGAGGSAKKTIKILKEINIKNEDLNNGLPAGTKIPAGVNLTDPSIPANTKQDFDTLLSFEIGKEADRTISIAKNFSKTYEGLLTNSIPSINTIVGENDEYKYDEEIISKKYPDYLTRKDAINNDTNLGESEKEKQIKELKREFYLKYLKVQNSKIGNALEQLYNNDFDYSKVDPTTLKDYFDKVADIRLKMLVDKGMNEFLSLNWGNFDEFKAFYKELTDTSNPVLNLRLLDVNRPGSTTTTPITGDIFLPIHRKIKEGPNEWLKDIDEFGKNADKSYDAFPMEFTINKADIERMNITIEDKTKLLNFLARFDQGDKYEIKGENIGNLIYLFFVINSKVPITEFDPEKQKKVEELFGKAKNTEHKKGENKEDNKEDNKDDDEESKSTKEEYLPSKFKEEIEKLWLGKFENGSEIWLPMGDSELPGGGYQWMKVKISDVNMTKGTFKGTVYGGELKFNSKLEGKTREFKMSKKTLDEFNNLSKDSNKVWLLPDPDSSDFNSFRDKLGGKLGTEELAFPPSGTTWTGDKFIKKIIDENGKEKEIEIKYFGASADDKSTYKVEYNPIRKSFTVSSSFNGDEKGKDGKSEKKRFSYKRDMDWNNFLIFFTQKGLVPQTEEEANSALQRQEQEFKAVNGGKWKLSWFSFNSIKNGLKDIFGAIKKKIDDYDKSQTEKFKGIVEGPLLQAIGSIPLLPPSIKGAIGERQQEIYNEELNGAWKEIEGYLKALQSDGRFADTFETVPAHVQTLYGKSYKQFIKDLFDRHGETSITEKRKAAALLLANYEKGGSPFRGLTEYENQGLWVKILLGEAHYQQFMRDKAACSRDRDIAEATKSEDSKGLNEQLATCEMDYIINNVRGAYPKLPGQYFPSHEKPGINGDNSTNYIPNPSKRLLSETFANKLEDAKKGRFTKDSVNEAYTKNKSINRFAIMEDEFNKCGSARYKQGAGALRRMFDLASNETLKKRAQKHFLTFLLSGVLDVNCDPGLKKQIYGWSKPMSFVPGMLVKEAGVAENIAILLDDIEPKGDFSRNVTKYFHKNGQLKGGIEFKGLQEEINKWLTDDKMDEINKYFSKLPTKDFTKIKDSHKKHILEKFKKSLLDEDVEEFDRGLLDNPTIVNNGLLTNINVVSDRLRIEDGEFKGKDSDDIANKKKFWENIKQSVAYLEKDAGNPKTVNFVLNKYFSWFGINSSEERQNIRKWINTAYYYKNKVSDNGGTYNIGHKTKIKNDNGNIIDETIPVGKIDGTDITKILLYGLEGNVRSRPPLSGKILPTELKAALDEFQKFFGIAFDSGALHEVKDAFKIKSGSLDNNDIFLLGGWDIYKEIARKDDGILESDDTEYNGNFRSLPLKKKKSIWRSILRDDDKYINPHMENIEKVLKRNRNTLTGNWKLTTSNDSDRLFELQEKLAT